MIIIYYNCHYYYLISIIYYDTSLQYMVREHLVDDDNSHQKKAGHGVIRK
jgi:hypothetical protein